jgi:hypothetical protein
MKGAEFLDFGAAIEKSALRRPRAAIVFRKNTLIMKPL